MINNFINLLAAFIPMFEYVLWFIYCFAFLTAVPCLIRKFIGLR